LLKDLWLSRGVSENLGELEVSLDSFLKIVQGNPTWRRHIDTTPKGDTEVVGIVGWIEVTAGGIFLNLMGERRSNSDKDLN
jgi:hypothetical protein